MNKIALVALAVLSTLLSSNMAFASTPTANINQGNLKVSGSLDFEHYGSARSGDTTFDLSPSVQYFLVDDLALGAFVDFNHLFADQDVTTVSLGPIASYHLALPSSKWVPFTQLAFGWNHTSTGTGHSNFNSTFRLGIEYFFTPSVALGPAFRWNHSFGNDYYLTSNTEGLVVLFSIYL